MDNAKVESFNGRFREECLNAHWFLSLEDAKGTIEAWRRYYNEDRPHDAQGWMTPAEFTEQCRNEASKEVSPETENFQLTLVREQAQPHSPRKPKRRKSLDFWSADVELPVPFGGFLCLRDLFNMHGEILLLRSLARSKKGGCMYKFRDKTGGLLGPGLAVGVAILTFLLGFWSALQAGANFGVVVVNFFTTLPILLLGLGVIIVYCNSIPSWAGIVLLAGLMWLLAHPVRHSVAEHAREVTEFGTQVWLGYLDTQVVEWGGGFMLVIVAAMLFRRRC